MTWKNKVAHASSVSSAGNGSHTRCVNYLDAPRWKFCAKRAGAVKRKLPSNLEKKARLKRLRVGGVLVSGIRTKLVVVERELEKVCEGVGSAN